MSALYVHGIRCWPLSKDPLNCHETATTGSRNTEGFVKTWNITEISWIGFCLIFMWDMLKKAYKVGLSIIDLYTYIYMYIYIYIYIDGEIDR